MTGNRLTHRISDSPPALIGGHPSMPPSGAPVSPPPIQGQASAATLDLDRIFAVVVGHAAAILLFFQVRVSIQGYDVTANLADPVALIALAMVAAFTLWQPGSPIRVSTTFMIWIGGLSLALAVSLFIGIDRFGVTSWALGNRAFGWLVLLGYVCAGALVVSQFGAHGRRRLTQTLVATALSVIVVHYLARLGFATGFSDFQTHPNFEGFSANRNTFAFQLLLAAAMLQCFIASIHRSGWLASAAVGLLYSGVIATGSLASIVAVVLLAGLIMIACPDRRWKVLLEILLAIGIAILAEAFFRWMTTLHSPMPRLQALESVLPFSFQGTSFLDRWLTIVNGLDLWLDHPIFGAGLGAFILRNVGIDSQPIVVHSTYVWILAETGLFGFALAAWFPAILLYRHAARLIARASARLRPFRPVELGVASILLVFALFSFAHEIAYQRIFWLLVGALAASAINGPKGGPRKSTEREAEGMAPAPAIP